jgi:hypothetical protein
MADQLFLSYTLRGYSGSTMMRHYEKLLNHFPYSKLSASQSTLTVTPISWVEPPVLEVPLNPPIDTQDVINRAKEFHIADCAVQLETYWDLWEFGEAEKDWKLAPSRVTLMCFGPQFEDEVDDHLRVNFGIDNNFLPQPDRPDSIRMMQSNIRSLLHLTAELDRVLNPENRRLWTESGESFVEKLMGTLPPIV